VKPVYPASPFQPMSRIAPSSTTGLSTLWSNRRAVFSSSTISVSFATAKDGSYVTTPSFAPSWDRPKEIAPVE